MSKAPFSSSNNYNAVKTLAGYKINSGPIGDYVYKDTDYTLALKPPTGGGPTSWNVTDGLTMQTVNNGDIVEYISGTNTTVTVSALGPTTHLVSQNAYPSGANREIQINEGGVFGVGANPARVELNGDLQLTTGINLGEIRTSAFVPSEPVAPDTYDGFTDPTGLGNESKIYKMKMELGTLGQNGNPVFQQQPFTQYGGGTPGYGFPAENPNMLYTGTNHAINGLNAIMGQVAPDPYGSVLIGNSMLAPGATTTEVPMVWGTRNVGTDSAFYDPLNLRALAGQSWGPFPDPIGSGLDYTMGFNENSLGVSTPGIMRITVYVSGEWNTAPPANTEANELGVFITVCDTVGNMRFNKRIHQHYYSYPTLGPLGPLPNEVITTGNTFIFTYDEAWGYQNAWYANDTCKIYLNVPSLSGNFVFQLKEFKAVCEYWPNA